MPSAVYLWQEAILKRLREGLPNNRIFLEAMPENEPMDMDPNAMVRPFLVLWFGSVFPGDPSLEAFCGVERSLRWSSFSITTVGPPSLALLQFEDAARTLLVGYRPADQGELSEWGTPTVRDPAQVGIGTDLRMYKTTTYRGLLNA